ncbi:hypothetical protein GCM10009721_12360 [Terrabacter tumescens]|uniref:Uncharacterized protein n=1 Tax=Terrabacter tumescens TaxID=60443 RepID=A0ABQ2HSS2_9MICO|nr:hypothetical protein [Terrabacter tumescens]GGM88765.1 hypothetical protein GCM10009721_12360 [Terrabacter tumescens]
MRDYPYAFHVALDGNGLNGLEGRAGVCLFRYDPVTGDHSYKVSYFHGASGGHAPSVDPSRRIGFLGNTGQHLLFYDLATLEEVDRVSTLRFEVPDTTIKGSTHLVWLDDTTFVTAIGEHLWSFDVNRLTKAEVLAPHGLKVPHAMKRTASGRYVVYGGMDHPSRSEAREVGILDTVSGEVRTVTLPTTCWHVVCHPVLDVFYAVSFRVHPADRTDYAHWGMAWLRQYAFEIDAEHGQVLRHWVADRDVPAHINSDVTISDSELIFCTGGSHTVVLVDLETMTHHRLVDEHPGALESWAYPRQSLNTLAESFMRANVVGNANLFAESFRVSRGSLIDGIYACQLSADQTLLFTANRGQNHISVYDYPSLELRDRIVMPELGEIDPGLSDWADPRLGFHHSYLVSPEAPLATPPGPPPDPPRTAQSGEH